MITFGLLILAVSTASLTLSRSSVFGPLRTSLNERAPFLGRLLACPYCTAHWVSFLYTSLSWDVLPVMNNHPAINVFFVALAVVPLTVPLMVMMYKGIPELAEED